MTSFSPEHIAGQRLLVGFDGTRFNEDLQFLIGELKVGGIILFSRNIESADQVRELTRCVQDYAQQKGQPPLFVAIDQEGGQVARLKPPFTQFPSGNPGMTDDSHARHFADVTAEELGDIGVNMDMAPVLDVQPRGFSGVMSKRVFNGNPSFVARMGNTVISGLQDRGIMAVAKHFPGIGRTTLDSHLILPVLDTDYDALSSSDFIPFEAAIENNVAGIMLSHIQYNALDDEWPASLSEKVVKGLLRQDMGYQGLVMTDDLDMKAIRVEIQVSVSRIIAADVDVALICHKGPDIERAFRVFLDNPVEDNMRSYERIMNVKKQYLGV